MQKEYELSIFFDNIVNLNGIDSFIDLLRDSTHESLEDIGWDITGHEGEDISIRVCGFLPWQHCTPTATKA